ARPYGRGQAGTMEKASALPIRQRRAICQRKPGSDADPCWRVGDELHARQPCFHRPMLHPEFPGGRPLGLSASSSCLAQRHSATLKKSPLVSTLIPFILRLLPRRKNSAFPRRRLRQSVEIKKANRHGKERRHGNLPSQKMGFSSWPDCVHSSIWNSNHQQGAGPERRSGGAADRVVPASQIRHVHPLGSVLGGKRGGFLAHHEA